VKRLDTRLDAPGSVTPVKALNILRFQPGKKG